MGRAGLPAESGVAHATAYRVEGEEGASDSSRPIHHLSFAEFTQWATAAESTYYGINMPEVIRGHGLGHAHLGAFSKTIAGGVLEMHPDIMGKRPLSLPPVRQPTNTASAASRRFAMRATT